MISKHSRELLRGSALAVVCSFAALAGSPAYADCSSFFSENVTCNNTSFLPIVTTWAGASMTITATDWTFGPWGSGRINVTLLGNLDEDVTFSGTNVSTPYGSGEILGTSYGAIHMSNANQNGDATIRINNTGAQVIKITGANSRGLTARTYSLFGNNGHALIEVSGVVVVMEHAIGGAALNAESLGSGNASVVMTGGSITTSGTAGGLGSGAPLEGAIRAVSQTGNATVRVTGGSVTTRGNSYGIQAETGGAGQVNVTSSANIRTEGDGGGIYARSENGGAGVTNSGDITTMANNAAGIDAAATGTGNVTVIHAGSVQTNGAAAAGILARTVDGDLTVTGVGTVETQGAGAAGIDAAATGDGDVSVGSSRSVQTNGAAAAGILGRAAAGRLTVDSSGAITTRGTNAAGIDAMTSGGNRLEVRNAAAIETQGLLEAHGILAAATGDGEVSVSNMNTITTGGSGSHGILAQSTGSGVGIISVGNTAEIDVGGDGSSGILARFTQAASSAAIGVNNTGDITVAGGGGGLLALGPLGIGAMTAGSGDINITGSGAISMTNAAAARSHGIFAQTQAGDVGVTYSGGIVTNGSDSSGIQATTVTGEIDIVNSGTITTSGTNEARGIFGQATGSTGHVTIASAGADITTSGIGVGNTGIEAVVAGGDASIAFSDATVRVAGMSFGLRAWDSAGTTTSTANVTVTRGIVDATASRGVAAVQALGGSRATVDLDAASEVHGGTWPGVGLGGGIQHLINAGVIDALSDIAVMGDHALAGNSFNLDNTGTITGAVFAASAVTTIANAGTWNLRSFVDTDGDGVRDTWRVAVSDLGASSTNTINNTGTLNLVAQAGLSATFDATGAYVPQGLVGNTPVAGGAVQGQILGALIFNNSGTIDLTGGGNAAGNVLVISGGHQPGADGGGVFVSNGGTLILNAVLNEGGANSLADVLVVDSTRLGSAPTGVLVRPVGGAGAYTPGDGILMVEVLNASASDPGAFVQTGRIVGGAYEYRLLHNGIGANAADGNWYLRSELPTPPPPNPPPVVPQYRPEVGAYLGNQMVALSMFRHTLHDRLGEVDYLERQRGTDEGRHAATWVRVTGHLVDSRAASSQLDLRTSAGMMQAGFEIGRWTDGDSRLLLGLMAGAGTARTTSRSMSSNYTAKGDVDGYSVGLYATWYQSAQDARGLYLDTWVQHAWYDNTVKGDQLASESYDSRALSASLEAGYAFELGRGENRAYYLEPQAQVIYTDYSADAHREAGGTRVRPDNASGFVTRLGARAYSRPLTMTSGSRVQPFIEFNWWHSMDSNSIYFDNVSVAQNMPRNTFETRLGAQAELGERWTAWGHAGLRLGASNFRDVDLLLGVKYSW